VVLYNLRPEVKLGSLFYFGCNNTQNLKHVLGGNTVDKWFWQRKRPGL
jgi:hypothetical protein